MHTINSLLTRQGFNTERKVIINAINIRMIPNFFFMFFSTSMEQSLWHLNSLYCIHNIEWNERISVQDPLKLIY